MADNTSQDPEYVGPTFHEKKFHKTHFQVMHRKLRRLQNGFIRRMNGTLYVWRDGKWRTNEPTTPNSSNRNHGG